MGCKQRRSLVAGWHTVHLHRGLTLKEVEMKGGNISWWSQLVTSTSTTRSWHIYFNATQKIDKILIGYRVQEEVMYGPLMKYTRTRAMDGNHFGDRQHAISAQRRREMCA